MFFQRRLGFNQVKGPQTLSYGRVGILTDKSSIVSLDSLHAYLYPRSRNSEIRYEISYLPPPCGWLCGVLGIWHTYIGFLFIPLNGLFHFAYFSFSVVV